MDGKLLGAIKMSSNSDLPWEIFPPTTGGVLPDTDPGGGGTGRPGVRYIH